MLPEKLRRQFADLERRLWKTETALAIGCAVSGLLLSFLVLFISDRLWDTPGWLRAVIMAGGVAVLAVSIMVWLRRWVWQRRDLRALADLVQRRFRRLGDRLLGVVELSNEAHRPADFSPQLYRAAIHQVAAEAESFDFRESVDSRPARKLALVTLCLMALVALPAALTPAAGWNTLHRWISPLASIDRYTLVAVSGLPEKLVVAHGESFEVAGTVEYRSFWRPRRVFGQYARQPRFHGERDGKAFRFSVPGQTEAGLFKVKVGDAQQTVLVQPTHRPSLRELRAAIQLPYYLRRTEVLNETLQGGALTVLEGSRISFSADANRDLLQARLQMEGREPLELAVDGRKFVTEPMALDGRARVAFTWEDQLGLTAAAPMQLMVQTRRDAPPVPELPDLAREFAILETEVLQIRLVARDDFGVSDFGLSWDFAPGADAHQPIASTEVKMDTGSPTERLTEDVFQWSPRMFRIPSDTTIELQAYARDFFPGRERIETPVYRIHVLGRERHAEMIRQRIESLLARVEEVTRLEEKILSRTIQASGSEQLESPEAAGQIAEIKDQQLQNARSLEQLSREGAELLREAMRNPLFSEPTVREWARNLQQMQQLSQEQMQQAASALESAGSDSESREQHLAEALQLEQEILEALERLQGKINQDLDDLQAMTLSQRLRKIGAVESEIGVQLLKVINETIGLLPRELSDDLRKLNEVLAVEQEITRAEAQELKGEIHRFFERTKKQNYGDVSQEMNDAGTVEGLERLQTLIAENVGMEASRRLDQWAERFLDWADRLEPPSSSGDGGGDGGGESQMQDVTRQLIALLRLREKEMSLHSETRVLDGQKENEAHYRDRAALLSETQEALRESLAVIQEEIAAELLDELFDETAGLMSEIETLLGKPQTDDAPQQAQVETIERLSDIINLINEHAQRQESEASGGDGGSEEMAFLMQMMAPSAGMGMEAGDEGGGSTAGGSTDRPASPPDGDAEGRPGEERRAHKASGAAGRNFPEEFRETLENYFRAVEEETK